MIPLYKICHLGKNPEARELIEEPLCRTCFFYHYCLKGLKEKKGKGKGEAPLKR